MTDDGPERPVALIFRTHLLPYSETFVRSQAEALTRFRPYYVGVRQAGGLELPPGASWLANLGGIVGLAREARFTFVGPSGGCVRRLRALRPGLIHAHFGPDGTEALRLQSELKIPLMVTYHGYDATFSDEAMAMTRSGRRYLGRRWLLQGRAVRFLAVSNFIKSRMEQQGFAADRITVHSIGVDLKIFQPPAGREPGLRVLFTGRLTEKKGCGYLIRAMASVQREVPEAELIVIGDGDEKEALEKQARATLTKFRFAGRQTPEEVRAWMQRCTLLSVPSVTAANGDAEGFGMVFAEAQACGLPVVSFASGGIPEAVAHGETGLLAPERDWERLAEYLLLLLRGPEMRHRFSTSGRLRVERLFDLHKQTRTLEEIYMEVAAGKPGAEVASGAQLKAAAAATTPA